MLPKSECVALKHCKVHLENFGLHGIFHPPCRKERTAQDPCLPAGAQGWKPKFSNAHHFHLCAAPWQHSSDTKFLDPSSGHTRSQSAFDIRKPQRRAEQSLTHGYGTSSLSVGVSSSFRTYPKSLQVCNGVWWQVTRCHGVPLALTKGSSSSS